MPPQTRSAAAKAKAKTNKAPPRRLALSPQTLAVVKAALSKANSAVVKANKVVNKVQLPANMLREIYKLANRHTQAKMHVLSTSTRNNKSMPPRSRSYLKGHGKYQKLWTSVPKGFKAFALQQKHMSMSLNMAYSRGTKHGKNFSMFIGAMVAMYKKTKQSNAASQIVNVDAAFKSALSMLKLQPQSTVEALVMPWFRRQIPEETMELETLMDKILVLGDTALKSMKNEIPQRVAMAKARPSNVVLPNIHYEWPTVAYTRQAQKLNRRGHYTHRWVDEDGRSSANLGRIARRANRRQAQGL